MLLFSLGPVQSFIAQARKTRDLWLGSYLLSILMEAAMQGMEQILIFPAKPVIEGNIPDLPNKYIAIFNKDDDAKEAAEQSERRIKICWNSICQDVWNKILNKTKLCDDTTWEIWKRQTDPERFFEIFWVIVKGNIDDYPTWLKDTQEALAARKRLRHITLQNSYNPQYEEGEEKGEKSTISGEREALRGNNLSREAVCTFWKEVAKAKHLSALDINREGEERLDAIDTVKRFAYLSRVLEQKKIDAYYPSTSSIATASFVERLLKENVDLTTFELTTDSLAETASHAIPYLFKLAKQHTDPAKLELLRRDGDCYFFETFTPYRLKKDYSFTESAASSTASDGQRALREFFKATDALHITRPTPYYAMIQMDGDKMGKLLDEVKDEKEHRDISKALSEFSKKAKHVVEENYPGRLIYAGGDDVFALAPLARDYVPEENDAEHPIKTVLDLVDQLQQTYQEVVKEPVWGDRKQNVTASTGIAIAHHFTSLSYVRRMAKDAEDLAKKRYGRNALVVTVLRRSGEQTRVGCHWEYAIERNGQQETIRTLPLFLEFYELFRNDQLSPKSVYNLLEEVPALISLDNEAQESEIRRVLRRQRSESKEDKLPDEMKLSNMKITELTKQLVAIAEAMNKDEKSDDQTEKKGEDSNGEQPANKNKKRKLAFELHSDKRRHGLVEVLGWLLVMVFLARKEQD